MSINKIKNDKPPIIIGKTVLEKLDSLYTVIRDIWKRIKDLELSIESINKKISITNRNKVWNTPEGGVAVLMTNRTGGTSVKGDIVTVSSSYNNAVSKIVINVPNPIGVIYEDGIADGEEVYVIVSGIADVGFVDSTTRGHIARGFLTADDGSYISGKALSEAYPTSPFATDKHWFEIGHILESRTAAGLAKTILHFN